MRLLLQRVSQASVTVEGQVVGSIGQGLLVLVGLGAGDDRSMIDPAIEKLINLRIFADEQGQMNRSVTDVAGGILAISQFTLYADSRKGRRPSDTDALAPAAAAALYGEFLARLRQLYTAGPVEAGIFAADMKVALVNDGPVTIMIDSAEMSWGRAPAPAKVIKS